MSSLFFLECKMDLFTPLSPRFWSQGQPSHSEHLGDGDQDCTIIIPSSKGQNWNDVDCNQLNRWVCKGTLGAEELAGCPLLPSLLCLYLP
uniref:C-type lectin domain-containing protein n=1 Tax=Laticauda laticaudata TaxID=8630 RepID=A0A8C5RN46_LATLA